MKIGVDISTMGGIRGPGRVTRELITSLAQLGSDDRFNLYTPFEPPAVDLPDNFAVRRVPRRRMIPWLNLLLPLSALRDGVDVMLFPANDCWILPFRRTVVIVLDLAQRTHLRVDIGAIDRLQNDLQIAMMPVVARKVVAISHFTADQLMRARPSLAGRISVAHLGVSQAFMVRRERGTGGYILFVSGFDKRKNLENLLRAYKMLIQRGRSERLVLKGVVEEGIGYYQDVPGLVRQHGLEGMVDIDISHADDSKLAALYQGASLLAVPSFIEGFGLPVLEAMACGCPVACSQAASLPEVGGEAALYFDPHSPEEMADVMERILMDRNLRRSMIEKGYKNVERFGWDKMARYVMETIYQAAARK